MNVINTNVNTSATNELAKNAVHSSATNESTSIINIDENNVNVINTNIDTNVTNEIASNEKNNDKEKKKMLLRLNQTMMR